MKVKVEIIEYELGWGQKVDSTKTFPNREKAVEFCEKYNAQNNKPVTPEWYMAARIVE